MTVREHKEPMAVWIVMYSVDGDDILDSAFSTQEAARKREMNLIDNGHIAWTYKMYVDACRGVFKKGA